MTPPLSHLFVPADRPDRIAKALTGEADAVIVDLEDGVAEPAKDSARHSIRECFSASPPPAGKTVMLRTNPTGSPHFSADLETARAAGLSTLMIPKCGHPEDLRPLRDWKGEIVLLIESAAGVHHLADLLRADRRIMRVGFGALDFALDLGVRWSTDGTERLHAMAQIVLTCRALELPPPVDAVFPDFKDESAFRRDAVLGLGLGFYGKMLIHPRQLPWLNAVYAPSADEVEWARKVLEAAARAPDTGAIQLDGRLIDRPVLLLAERILLKSRR